MKVVINRKRWDLRMSDEAFRACIDRGLPAWSGYPTEPPDGPFLVGDDASGYGAHQSHLNEMRSHPAVVAVVEEMGEAASAPGSQLVVVDIPFSSTAGWHLAQHEDEQDGSRWEMIVEDHRVWS